MRLPINPPSTPPIAAPAKRFPPPPPATAAPTSAPVPAPTTVPAPSLGPGPGAAIGPGAGPGPALGPIDPGPEAHAASARPTLTTTMTDLDACISISIPEERLESQINPDNQFIEMRRIGQNSGGSSKSPGITPPVRPTPRATRPAEPCRV